MIEIAPPPLRVVADPGERFGDVLHRRRERVIGGEAVADVEDQEAPSREGEPHDPVSVLRKDAKAPTVDVEHDGEEPLPIDRAIDVEEVGRLAGLVVVGDVADDLDAVTVRGREGMELAEAGRASKEAVDDGGAGAAPYPIQGLLHLEQSMSSRRPSLNSERVWTSDYTAIPGI